MIPQIKIEGINSIELLDDKILVVCGNWDGKMKIKSYNLQTAVGLFSLNLGEKGPMGMAKVQFGDKLALAVAHQ